MITIRNGDILEITKSKRLPVKNRLRNNKMNTTSEQQEKRNIKYATNLLRLLLLHNFNENDLYCTLTYDKPVAGEEAKKHLANFRKRLQRLAKKLDVEAKYIERENELLNDLQNNVDIDILSDKYHLSKRFIRDFKYE